MFTSLFQSYWSKVFNCTHSDFNGTVQKILRLDEQIQLSMAIMQSFVAIDAQAVALYMTGV